MSRNIRLPDNMNEVKDTKLWPTQRSTVARLGLLHRNGSISRTSILSIESSDTFVSDTSSSVREWVPNIKNKSGEQNDHMDTISENSQAISKTNINDPTLKMLHRDEVLDSLRKLQHPSQTDTPHKSSIFRNPMMKGNENVQCVLFTPKMKEDRKKRNELILSNRESWVTCADFKNSELLNAKSPEEREEFTELCLEAIAEKVKTYDKLMKSHSEVYEDKLRKITCLNRDKYKSQLYQVMLKLINNEKDRVDMKKQKYRPSKTEKPLLWSHKGLLKQKLIQQVYVLRGRTIVGSPLQSGTFPNTFASVLSLIDPRYDTPGYRRFTIVVDVGDLTGEEILIQLYNGKNLIFMKINMEEEGPNSKTLIQKVELPAGVFADKLRVAREGNGPLILQEPWKF